MAIGVVSALGCSCPYGSWVRGEWEPRAGSIGSDWTAGGLMAVLVSAPAQRHQPNATNVVPPTWYNQTGATSEPPVRCHQPSSSNPEPTWCHQPDSTTSVPPVVPPPQFQLGATKPTPLSHPHPWPLGKPLTDGPSISHPCTMGFSPAMLGS